MSGLLELMEAWVDARDKERATRMAVWHAVQQEPEDVLDGMGKLLAPLNPVPARTAHTFGPAAGPARLRVVPEPS